MCIFCHKETPFYQHFIIGRNASHPELEKHFYTCMECGYDLHHFISYEYDKRQPFFDDYEIANLYHIMKILTKWQKDGRKFPEDLWSFDTGDFFMQIVYKCQDMLRSIAKHKKTNDKRFYTNYGGHIPFDGISEWFYEEDKK